MQVRRSFSISFELIVQGKEVSKGRAIEIKAEKFIKVLMLHATRLTMTPGQNFSQLVVYFLLVRSQK